MTITNTDPPGEPTPETEPGPETPPEPETEPESSPTVEDPEALLASHEKYRHENISLRKRLATAETQIETQRQSALTEQEKAIEAARAEGRKEAEADLGRQLLEERILARATGKMVDPSDAIKLLDLDQFALDQPDDIDEAIEELVKAKPHLAAVSGSRPRIDQGPQGRMVNTEDATGDDWLRRVAGRG